MHPKLLLIAALSAGIVAPAFAFSQPVMFPPTIDVPPITAPQPQTGTQNAPN